LSPQANYTDRLSDCRLSAKLMPNLADRGCRVVSATIPPQSFILVFYTGFEYRILFKISFSWDLTTCSLLTVNLRYEGTICLHLHSRRISQERNQGEAGIDHHLRWRLQRASTNRPMSSSGIICLPLSKYGGLFIIYLLAQENVFSILQNIPLERLAFLFCIPEIRGSNLRPVTGYPDKI
jgi:hypothetical protein